MNHGPINRPEAPGERLLVAVMRWLAPADCADEIVGDLLEEAERRMLPRHGRALTAAWLLLQVIASAPHLAGMRLRRLWPERMTPVAADVDGALVTRAEAHAAFASFLSEAHARRSLPRVPLALAVAAHGALFGVAVLASMWPALDELAPPSVMVTWLPAGPPPMQDVPPPPASGGEPARGDGDRKHLGAKRAAARSIQRSNVPTQADSRVEGPPTNDDPEAPGHGDVAGNGSGSGHQGNGEGDGDGQAHVLPPQVVARSCLACDPPTLPPAWAVVGIEQRLMARVCVGADGAVKTVRVLQGISPSVDEGATRTMRGWRFSPYQVQGRPVPFCYTTRIVFKTR